MRGKKVDGSLSTKYTAGGRQGERFRKAGVKWGSVPVKEKNSSKLRPL